MCSFFEAINKPIEACLKTRGIAVAGSSCTIAYLSAALR